jgi:hypothetical protein
VTAFDFSASRDAKLAAERAYLDAQRSALHALTVLPVGGRVRVASPDPRLSVPAVLVLVRSGFGYVTDDDTGVPSFPVPDYVVDRYAVVEVLEEPHVALARELAEQNDAADIEQERRDDSAYDDHLDRIAGDQDRSELEDEE